MDLEKRMQTVEQETKDLLIKELDLPASELSKVLNLIETYAMLYYEQGLKHGQETLN
jgi:hypothetical protein